MLQSFPIKRTAPCYFIGVFCGATNTPIAWFIMGIEPFGSEASIYLFIACIVSYLFSGHTGSQQIEVSKNSWIEIPKQATLASVKKRK